MKLIELSANQTSFKTIYFNPQGLTLILGSGSKNKKSEGSSNGVGKTLALGLVHHCLGANVQTDLKEALTGWVFKLRFELNGQEHCVERSADGKHLILDNNIKFKNLNAYREWLNESRAFNLNPQQEYLTFRALFSRFARYSREDCNDPIRTSKEPEVEAQLRTFFLLGLKYHFILKKRNHKKRLDNLKNTIKNWENDPLLHELFRAGNEPQLRIEWLDKEIPRLEADLDHFEVAENYHALKLEAQEKTRQLRELEREIAVRQFQIEGIEKSLKQQPDISRHDLLKLYQGLQNVFKPEVLTHFEAVEIFHREFMKNRKTRLEADKEKIIGEIDQKEQKRQDVGKQRDDLMKELKVKRALDEYTTLSNQLGNLKAERTKLADYLAFTDKLQQEVQTIKAALLNEDKQTIDYVKTKPVENYHSYFQNIANQLYPRVPAGIVLENNSGDNQLRYQFSVQIEGDASDGINAARVLCFDWLLLMHGKNHNIHFLWHDSRLFADMGANPRAIWFGYVLKELTDSKKQYIASLSIENYESMREHLNSEQWEELANTIRLTLHDDDPKNKLLGIQFGYSNKNLRLNI